VETNVLSEPDFTSYLSNGNVVGMYIQYMYITGPEYKVRSHLGALGPPVVFSEVFM